MALPSFGDMLKGQWRAMRHGEGKGWNAAENYKFAKEAQRQREAQSGRFPRSEDGGWYSKYKTADGRIHVMLDAHGVPTDTYPHVHVIHDEPGSEIRMHITWAKNKRGQQIVLPGDAGGNEVNAAIDQLRRQL